MADETFAVVGATGTQGGAVVRALLAAGARVRGLTRDPDSDGGRALADAGASPVRADPGDPDSVRDAFRDVDAAYVMTTLAGDAEADQGRALIDAAVDAGVGRVVLASVGGADRGTGIPHFEAKWQTEEHARATGVPLRVVRPVFFMDNLQPTVEDGTVVLRAPMLPEVPVQMIASDDIGRVMAAVLLDADAVSEPVEIGADEPTPQDAARAFGERAGLPARFEPIPIDTLEDDDQRAMFSWFTTPPAYEADFAATAALAERDGGPPPADFAAYLERTGWHAPSAQP